MPKMMAISCKMGSSIVVLLHVEAPPLVEGVALSNYVSTAADVLSQITSLCR